MCGHIRQFSLFPVLQRKQVVFKQYEYELALKNNDVIGECVKEIGQ